MIIAGIDEAGYGPLLGPLVVSCSALEVPAAAVTRAPALAAAPAVGGPWSLAETLPLEMADLPCCWRLLKAAVAKKAPITKGRLLIADSKLVHNLTHGDRLLERGVLSFLRATDLIDGQPLPTSRILTTLGCDSHGLPDHPWYAAQDLPVPVWCDPGDLAIATNMLKTALAKAQVRIAALRTTLVPERQFNQLVAGTNNKASALISLTFQHLYYLHTTFGNRGLIIGVDKQGGREHYTQLLLQSFPDAQLRVLMEGDQGSSYLLTEGDRRTVIHFREKGETHFLPVALASMVCKYLREVCMHTFNTWWCAQVQGLLPTAGYYQDGTRWLTDVAPHLPRLGIQREHLVRCR